MIALAILRPVRCSRAARAVVFAAVISVASVAGVARAESLSAESAAAQAARSAPIAVALENEAAALCCELNSRHVAARQQVALMQRVLHLLAAHARNEAAGEALADYFQLLGLRHQLRLTDEAAEVLLRLKNAAEIARELEIAQNGTAPEAVVRQQLQLEDQRAELRGAIELLELSLARRTGALLATPEPIELSDELVVEYREQDPEQAVEVALERRQDLQALAAVCSCLNSQTAPAARTMLGVVQPGLGLSAAAASPSLLSVLRHGDATNPRCRVGQCAQLQENRRRDVEAETRAAVLRLHTAYHRLALADEIVESFEEQIEGLRQAPDAAETPTPQLDRLTLELLEARGRYYERLTDARLAEIELQQTQGVLYPEWPGR